MFTWIRRIAWLALSAFLAVRIYEMLFTTNQTVSVFPFVPDIGDVDVSFLVGGVAWGILLAFGSFGGFGGSAKLRRGNGPVLTAPATIIEVRRTGLSINDVPQYEIFLDIDPVDGEPFVSSIKQLVNPIEAASVQPGGQ